MSEVVISVLVLLGASLVLVGAIGIQRFEDPFARMHAATKPVTLGLALVLVGAAVEHGDAETTAQLFLAALFQFGTAPMGMTLIGRAAYDAGVELAPNVLVDDLATDRAAEAERDGGDESGTT